MVDHNKKPSYDEDKMKKYLLKLKKQISEKKLTFIVMIMDDMTVLYRSGTERFDRPGFLKLFQEEPEK